jgi:hypothetical protein
MKSQATSGRTWRFHRDQIGDLSPSRTCGVTYEQEHCLRRAGVAQIIAMAVDLFSSDRRVGLWRQPATTACILFQRFFARQSFTSHNRWTVASACLFLGCKVEELHRKARDIIGMVDGLKAGVCLCLGGCGGGGGGGGALCTCRSGHLPLCSC